MWQRESQIVRKKKLWYYFFSNATRSLFLYRHSGLLFFSLLRCLSSFSPASAVAVVGVFLLLAGAGADAETLKPPEITMRAIHCGGSKREKSCDAGRKGKT